VSRNSAPMSIQIPPGVHRMPLLVPASAIDELGHVNNVTWLSWLQEAATAHSTALGWSLERYRELGAGWVVGSHYIEYLRPAFQGDSLEILTWVASLESRRSLRRYSILRDGQPLVRAETMWVFVDFASGRSRSVVPEVAEVFPIMGTDLDFGASGPAAGGTPARAGNPSN
jgi:acyl-CoA thioester hydrolase